MVSSRLGVSGPTCAAPRSAGAQVPPAAIARPTGRGPAQSQFGAGGMPAGEQERPQIRSQILFAVSPWRNDVGGHFQMKPRKLGALSLIALVAVHPRQSVDRRTVRLHSAGTSDKWLMNRGRMSPVDARTRDNSLPGRRFLPVSVNVTTSMSFFTRDTAVVRLIALLIVKVPVTLAASLGVLHWLQ